MTKQQIRKAIQAMLRRWSVPAHLAQVRDLPGCVAVTFLPRGGDGAVTTEVESKLGGRMAKDGLLKLETVIRRNGYGKQTDIEEFTGA